MDDIGVDSIETAVMFGVAMEAGVLPFATARVWCACYATKSARAHRSVVCLAAVPVSSSYLWHDRVPVVKNQAFPLTTAFRQSIGVTYAMATMGRSHFGYAIATNILGVAVMWIPCRR